MYHRISGRDSYKIGIVKVPTSVLTDSSIPISSKVFPHECEHFRDYLTVYALLLSSEVVKGRLESTEWDLW